MSLVVEIMRNEKQSIQNEIDKQKGDPEYDQIYVAYLSGRRDALSNENLFLIIIAVAIGWQMVNSHNLAREADQDVWQARFFSVIMSLGIFICVANGQMNAAYAGVVIETLVNILLVLKKQHPSRLQLEVLKDQLEELSSKERKGIEIKEIKDEIKKLRTDIGVLPSFIKLFIGLLIPAVILFMSELYIG